MKVIARAMPLILLAACSPPQSEPPITSSLSLGDVPRILPRAPMCRAADAPCTASAQCCSNNCDFSQSKERDVGVCGGMELIKGPLADVVPAVRHDPRLSPPVVEEAFASPFKDGTLVSVRFGRDQKLGRAVALQAEDGDIVLEDTGEAGDEKAGDGLFSTVIPFAFDDVRGKQKELLAELRERKISEVPIFEGRELVGMRKIDFDLGIDRIPLFPFPIPFFVDPERSLMIRATSVVEDPGRTFNPCTGVGTPNGKWTFAHLITEMANQPVTGVNPSDFAKAWLSRWTTNQVVNTFNVPPRLAINNLLASWPKLPDGRLDLSRAPLKLIAIVNRIDLAGSVAYGKVGGAEGRFVFEVLDPNTCSPQQFLVIFEYGVPRNTCLSLKDWAQKWKALSLLPIGSPMYNAKLEALTEEFASANADLTKFNGSAINQVRTNEIDLAFPWELREFKLEPLFPEVPLLREATVKQTPDVKFNGTKGGPRAPDLATWINNHTPEILAGTHSVPNNLDFAPFDAFLGASTLNNIDFWNAPGIANLDARHKFSLATCNACHGRETNTIFTHVKPAPFGLPAGLSGFLTGIVVNDPVTGTPRAFHDLADRAGKLNTFASATCFKFPPPFPIAIEVLGPFPLPPIGIKPTLLSH